MEKYTKKLNITDNITDDVYYVLGYEQSIKIKKENNIKLSEKEQIFDNYIVSPSLLYKLLIKRLENDRTRRKTK